MIRPGRHLLAHIIRSGGKFAAEQTALLVKGKKAWAADMRDLATNGPIPVETQQAVWRDYIGA